MTNAEIWVLYDGKAGHLSQSHGLAERLASRMGAQVKIVKARPRLGVLRILAVWLCRQGLVLPRALLSLYRCRLPSGAPALVVSFGGKVVPLNLALASLYNCDNILIGNRYQVPEKHFSVLVNARDEDIPHQVVTRVPFSSTAKGLTPDDMERLARLQRSPRPLWLMLLGGEGSGFTYSDEDWKRLKQAMIALAEQQGIRWLVSSSRRTPSEGEALLADAQLQEYCQDTISFKDNGPGIGVFLQAAERVFVTADSLSMVTEAVANSAAVPVVGLLPADVAGAGGIHQQTLNHYRQRRWLELLPIISLATFEPANPEILATYPQVLEATVSQIEDCLASRVQGTGDTERYYQESY